MIAAYRSGDPYLAFAKQAGAVPPGATKQSHSAQRELFKQCVLAVQYGMGPTRSRCVSVSRRWWRGIYCARIKRPTAHSGVGPMLRSINATGFGVNLLVADAIAGLLVELVKTNLFALGRRWEQCDRARDE